MSDVKKATIAVARFPARFYWERIARMCRDCGEDDDTIADRCQLCMRIFYGFVFLLAFRWTSEVIIGLAPRSVWNDRLSIWLSDLFPIDLWPQVSAISTFVAAGASLLCVVQPSLRLPRIAVAIAIPVYWAINFAMKGKIDHGHHLVIWAAIIFALVPVWQRGKSDASATRSYIGMFFGATAVLGLTYTSAGLCKLIGVYFDASEGMTWLHPDALPIQLASHWNRAEQTLFAPFIITHAGPAWVMNAGVLYMEVCTFIAVFNSRLHRLWGLALCCMHFGVMHSMHISFANGVMPLVLLLIASPLAPSTIRWRETLLSLPVVAFVGARIRRGDPAAVEEVVKGPRSAFVRWCVPAILMVYFVVGFSRFSPSKQRFEQDVFPISAMPMFWRINDNRHNLDKLEKLRAQLRSSGRTLFPQRVVPPPKPSKPNKRK